MPVTYVPRGIYYVTHFIPEHLNRFYYLFFGTSPELNTISVLKSDCILEFYCVVKRDFFQKYISN